MSFCHSTPRMTTNNASGPLTSSTVTMTAASRATLANMPPLNMAHVHDHGYHHHHHQHLHHHPAHHHSHGHDSPLGSSTMPLQRLSLAGLVTPSASSSSAVSSASSSSAKKAAAMLAMSPACSFEAFSHHFHLPLKAAAEKFGVRATAFKKRCRAIGIRHWPYRKVRSLKRSLQELHRCKDQGILNDKQQSQYATFKKQLDKLLAPETYGIDPTGRLPQSLQQFEDDGQEEEQDDEDSGDDDSYGSQSPRYSGGFAECSISPADTDKTFGDFPASQPAPSHLRSFRKHHSTFAPSSHMSRSLGPFSSELPGMSYRTQSSMPYKYPYGGYDHYLHDNMAEKPAFGSVMRSLHHPLDEHPIDGFGDHPTSGMESGNHEFLPSEMKYDEVRPLHSTSEEDLNEPSAHIDYSSERFFDDVFLQISPDYGCLV